MTAPSANKLEAETGLVGHTRVEINTDSLHANVRIFRELCPGSAFMAVVKSNAYGHGLRPVVEALTERVDWFGVNSISEAAGVRQYDSHTPILVMGRFAPTELPALRSMREVHVVVSAVEDIRALTAGAPDVSFHLKVDTGMGRLGSHGDALARTFTFLAEHKDLPWAGILTHFANVEDVTDQDYARTQIRRFEAACLSADQVAFGRQLLRHAAASAPALLLAETRLDVVRVGISLYGLWPSRETRISSRTIHSSPPVLCPVMRWVTSVVHINEVGRDECIGYGCTHRADRDMRIAVLPVGYYEGYHRNLSNHSFVLINNRRARVVGRVCMNMIMADITDHGDVAVGTDAVLIGLEERGEPSADYLAEQADTINYEITTKVHEAFPRIAT